MFFTLFYFILFYYVISITTIGKRRNSSQIMCGSRLLGPPDARFMAYKISGREKVFRVAAFRLRSPMTNSSKCSSTLAVLPANRSDHFDSVDSSKICQDLSFNDVDRPNV